jgi:peptidoglycan/LPS O-acetylase OafA/YrhL
VLGANERFSAGSNRRAEAVCQSARSSTLPEVRQLLGTWCFVLFSLRIFVSGHENRRDHATTSNGAAELKSRNQSLDVLRGIAILLVMGRHFDYFLTWRMIGWSGVDLFFVLSGYLISGLLFRDYIEFGRIRVGRFLLRRGFKIWPPLYGLLFVVCLLLRWSGASTKDAWLSALFVRNYFMGPNGSFLFGHTWSLCVEEHFYVLLPFLLVLLTRRRRGLQAIPCVSAALLVLCLGSRIVLHPAHPYATHLRLDGLFAGVTLRYMHDFRREWFRKISGHWSLPAAAVLLAPIFALEADSGAMRTWGLTATLLGFALLVAWSVDRKPYRLFRPLAAIGLFSYSIYLWQQPISLVIRNAWGNSALTFALYLGLAIIGGILMAKLIEIPALRLRDKLQDDDLKNLAFVPDAANGDRAASTRPEHHTPENPIALPC